MLRTPVLSLLIILSSSPAALGFQNQIDSLQALINTRTERDLRQVVLLHQFAALQFQNHQVIEGINSFRDASSIASQNNYEQGEALAYQTLSVYYDDAVKDMGLYYHKKAERQAKSIGYDLPEYPQLSTDEIESPLADPVLLEEYRGIISNFEDRSTSHLKAAVLVKLGHYAMMVSETEEAITYLDKAMNEFEQLDEIYPVIYCLSYKMSQLNILGRTEASIAIESELNNLFLTYSDNKYIGLISKTIAAGYVESGRFLPSIKYYLNSIETFQQSNELQLLPGLYRDLGIAYENLYLFSKSVNSYKKAISTLKELDSDKQLSGYYSYLIFPLIELGKLDEAKKYIELAEQDTLKEKSPFQMARLYDARGQILMKQGDYGKAISFYNKALTGFAMTEETHWGIPYVLLNISESYLHLGKIDKALTNALNANEHIYEGQLKLARRTNQLLSKLYELKGDEASALRYLKEYQEIVEQSNRNDELSRLADAEIQAIMEKSKREIIELERERQLANQQSETQRLWLIIVITVLIFTLVLSYTLYRNYKMKTRSNTELRLEKQKVEQALNKLKTTKEQLIQQEKLASLGQLTAGVAHEIKNPLNFVTNFSDLSKSLISELKDVITNKDEEVQDILSVLDGNLNKITEHAERADFIVQGMLQHSRTGKTEKKPTDINALADKFMRLSYHGFRAKDKQFNANLQRDFDPDIGEVVVDPQEIGRVILNIITNSLHAVHERARKAENDFQPKVRVTTRKSDSEIRITVTDNGNGIPDDIAEKIFDPFFTTKKGTEGTGLGLSISNDIVQAYGGKFEVTSDSDGTSMTFTIPV